jgi:hypothetical protein
MVRPSCAAAVKDGPTWGPPGGLVLDGREHGGRLVCVGIGRMTTLVVDRGEIPDQRMTTARVIETLDKLEHRDPRFGLRLEPAPIEKLTFHGTKVFSSRSCRTAWKAILKSNSIWPM